MDLELEKYTKLKPDMKDYEHNLERLKSYDMIGWMEIDENVDDIIETAKNIDLLVVIGIGGSYMGAKALVNMFSNPFTPSKVIFAGYTLDSHYLNQLKEYIKDKNVVLNVISKSGTTLEIKKTLDFSRVLDGPEGNRTPVRKPIPCSSTIIVSSLTFPPSDEN